MAQRLQNSQFSYSIFQCVLCGCHSVHFLFDRSTMTKNDLKLHLMHSFICCWKSWLAHSFHLTEFEMAPTEEIIMDEVLFFFYKHYFSFAIFILRLRFYSFRMVQHHCEKSFFFIFFFVRQKVFQRKSNTLNLFMFNMKSVWTRERTKKKTKKKKKKIK